VTLLKSTYEQCLARELAIKDISFEIQIPLPVIYKGLRLDCGYRVDLLIEKQLIIELKAVEKLAPIHEAQILTYMKLANISIGLLLNFNEELLNNYKEWGKNEIIDKAETEILNVSNKYNADESQVYINANKDVLERYKEKKPNKNGFSGFPTNLDRVNKFSRGLLKRGSVTVINAQAKTGKSMFLKSQAKFLAIDNGIPVYLGANEQNIEEQEKRIIQEITGLPTIIIENNLFNSPKEIIEVEGETYKVDNLKEKVYNAVEKIEEAPIFFDKISGYTPSSLVQRARYFKKRHNIQVFIWDYVKESSATSLADGQLRFWLSNVVRTLKEEIADALDLAVLTASQAKTYEYWLSAESYGIEKFSTSFCILRKLENKEKSGFDGDYAFTIKANRYGREHGDFRNDWISLDLNEKYLRFEEIDL